MTRAVLEKTDAALIGQTKQSRKQLLDALFGKDINSYDYKSARIGLTGKDTDKARFIRRSLGGKVSTLRTKEYRPE